MPSVDPTKTAGIRNRYAANMKRRFAALAKDVRTSFNRNRALTVNEPANLGRFDFPTNPEKVRAFQNWLQEEIDAGILEVVVRDAGNVRVRTHWQDAYIRAAYIRAVNDTEAALDRVGELNLPMPSVEVGIHTGVHGATLETMYSRAFEGLKGITQAMSNQLSDIFSRSLIEGVGPRVIAKRISDQIATISRNRAMVLARTETIRTYSEARLNTLEQNGIEGVEADVEFLTAGDSRVCQTCSSLNGKVYTIQGARGIIPVHPRCLPGDAKITASPRISAVFKRWYDGDMIVINTSSNERLVCTPNHPVLTEHGFIAAKLIHVGNQVVGGQRIDRMTIRHADYYDVPSSIENIAESFFRSSKVLTCEMPMSSEYFYGDGIDGEVYIVGADIELLDGMDAAFFEEQSQFNFEVGNARLLSESTISHSALMFKCEQLSSTGLMSGLSLVSPLGISEKTPLDGLCFASSPWRDAVIQESISHQRSRDIEFLSQPVDGHASMIQPDHIVSRNVYNSWITDANPLVFQNTQHSFVGDAKMLGDVLGWSSGDVSGYDVSYVDVVDFHGYVYDLQTDGGFFIANSIAVSNCRCTWVPVNIGKQRNAA